MGAIFQTALHGDTKETWVISQYEPMAKTVFVRYNPSTVTRPSIELTEERDHSRAVWTQSQVAMDENDNSCPGTVNHEDSSASIGNYQVVLSH